MIEFWLHQIRLVEVLPWLAVVVFTVANLTTIRDTWAGTAGSSPVTWSIWALLSGIALAAQLRLGGWSPAAVLLVPVTVACTLIAIGAIRRYRDAEPGVPWQRKVDLVCGIGATASLVALLAASNETALVLTLVTDLTAAVPTITMAWYPSREQPIPIAPFTSIAFSAACTILAADWTVWELAYPIYLFGLGVGMATIILLRRRTLAPAEPALDVAAAADPLRLTPSRSLRPPPRWPERTTERMLPPWWRTPHADALAALVPSDLLDRDSISPSRMCALMEEVYTAAHHAGWHARERARAIPPPLAPALQPGPQPRPRPKPQLERRVNGYAAARR